MSDDTELEQITAAAHFRPEPYEDYGLADRVFDLYVQSQVLVKLLAAHPELQSEMNILAQQIAAAARG